jgi:putative ABC transport system substrate-binding protein
VISTGPAASINDKGMRLWQAFFEELRRLGDVEGQNLAVERYSGKGRPERFADLAREVVSRNPDLIVAIGPLITLAVSAATSTVPIVATGTHPMVSPELAP